MRRSRPKPRPRGLRRDRIRAGRKAIVSAADAQAHAVFQRAAELQGRCAVPGCRERAWHPHHVLYDQHLRRWGMPRWDARNALRVCPHHHAGHHGAMESQKLQRSWLRPENVRYILEVLGEDSGLDYLARHYGDG